MQASIVIITTAAGRLQDLSKSDSLDPAVSLWLAYAFLSVAVSGFIGEDLFLSFGMGVFEPTQTVKLRYQVNRRLALEAMSSLQSAITLFYTWRF